MALGTAAAGPPARPRHRAGGAQVSTGGPDRTGTTCATKVAPWAESFGAGSHSRPTGGVPFTGWFPASTGTGPRRARGPHNGSRPSDARFAPSTGRAQPTASESVTLLAVLERQRAAHSALDENEQRSRTLPRRGKTSTASPSGRQLLRATRDRPLKRGAGDCFCSGRPLLGGFARATTRVPGSLRPGRPLAHSVERLFRPLLALGMRPRLTLIGPPRMIRLARGRLAHGEKARSDVSSGAASGVRLDEPAAQHP
jgi:hypothetical protein